MSTSPRREVKGSVNFCTVRKEMRKAEYAVYTVRAVTFVTRYSSLWEKNRVCKFTPAIDSTYLFRCSWNVSNEDKWETPKLP
jgi:hypothetical protein